MEPAATEPTEAERARADQAAPESVAAGPVAVGPVAVEAAAAESVAVEATAVEAVAVEPVAVEAAPAGRVPAVDSESEPASPSGDWVVSVGEQVPQLVDALLRSLPEWFGIESSIVEYVAAAEHLPTYLVRQVTGEPAGVLLAARHFPGAAEIYLMAVARSAHRTGVGRALIEALEADLIADGAKFLQVKTLGPAHPDSGYAKTRLFYLAMGFAPLEENHDLWPGNPCLIMIKSLIGDSS
jgi:GNAT superfamily N-acetyltransferase